MTPTQSRADSQAHAADKPPDLSIANEPSYATLMSDKYIQGDRVQDSKTTCFFLSVSQEQKSVLKVSVLYYRLVKNVPN